MCVCVCVLCERGDREGETVAEIEIGSENGNVVSLAWKEGEGERKMVFIVIKHIYFKGTPL